MARKRGQISKYFVGLLLVLLMVGLAGFGVTNFGGRIRSVGEVGNVEIGVNQYARTLNEELQTLQQRIGQNISLEQARQFGLDAQVLQRLIAQAALENETSRIGLSVDDVEVQRQLIATQGFRGLDGSFDQDSYEFVLERNNMSAREYEADIRQLTAGTIVQSGVIAGVTASETYGDVVLEYLGERRSFSWLELDAKSLATALTPPSDTDLSTYFAENPDAYMLPPSKKITYAWLSPDFVMDQIEVDEDTLRALYDGRSAEFNTPERRLVERLVFATMEQAQSAYDQIQSGTASFDDVVTERGLNLADIDLGDVTQSALGAAANSVFALAEPGITEPVTSDLGPAVFRVNAILAARLTPFEDARAALLDEAAADNARRLVADQIAELDDLLAGGATLEEMAQETDMQLGTIDWSIGNTDDIAAYQGFASAAALVTTADFPAIETLDDGGIFAMRLDAEIDERPDSFENVRPQIVIDWNAAALSRALQAESAVMLASLSGGATLSSLGHPVAVETNAKRDAVYLGKPVDFLSSVFELEPGTATSVQGTGMIFIMQINDILGADPQDPEREALRNSINDSVQQSIGEDALVAFTRALQQSAGISLNQTAINAVHSQFSTSGGGFVPPPNQGMPVGGHN
ncbi:MAG: SurA N-terminal domain-containing protein [Paracoccaceae bacterium]